MSGGNLLNITVKNIDEVKKNLDEKKKNSEKAVKATVRDMKSRGPAQVTKAVTAKYAIKAGDVSAAGKAAKGTAKTVGSIKVQGQTIDRIQITYKGRVLTPTHFPMAPKVRPANGRKYTVKATIKKGSRKSLGPAVFLGSTGDKQIPFQRTGEGRLPIKAIKTVSIPQMISNEEVAEEIEEKLNKLMDDRLEHNLKRFKVVD